MWITKLNNLAMTDIECSQFIANGQVGAMLLLCKLPTSGEYYITIGAALVTTDIDCEDTVDYGIIQMTEIIDYGVENAKRFKIKSDLGFAAFITLMFACGAEFHEEPEIADHLTEQEDPDTGIIDLAEYYLNEYEDN